MRDNTHDDAYALARLTLLALASGVELDPRPPQPPRVIELTPDSSALTPDEAIERLASLAKPVRCSAARIDDRLVIACEQVVSDAPDEGWSLAPLGDPDYREFGLSLKRRLIRTLYDCHGPDALCLVRGRYERMLCGLDVIERWWREYEVDVSSVLRDADKEAREQGAAVFIAFERPFTITSVQNISVSL